MKDIASILAELPESMATSYDGMTISEPHWDRMVQAHIGNAKTAIAPIQSTYAGIRVVARDIIPDGFAVLTKGGKPVGVIDFIRGTATLARNACEQKAQR